MRSRARRRIQHSPWPARSPRRGERARDGCRRSSKETNRATRARTRRCSTGGRCRAGDRTAKRTPLLHSAAVRSAARASGSRWRSRSHPASRRAEVYWFDDQPGGGVRVPASWRLLYKDGDQWKPVETSDAVRGREGCVEQGDLQPVTTTRAAARGRPAAGRFRRVAGMEESSNGPFVNGPDFAIHDDPTTRRCDANI